MLKKLFKYDFNMLSRYILPLYAVLGGLTVITKLLFLAVKGVESTGSGIFVWVQMFSNISYNIYIIFLFAFAVLIILAMIYRFYRNFFSTQGYLMFTLPIKSMVLIASKLFSSLCYFLISLFTVLISLFLVFVDANLIERINTEIKSLDSSKIYNFIIFVLIIVSSFILFILTTYLAMALGQTFKKLKVFGSFLSYIFIALIVQVSLVSSLLLGSFLSEIDLFKSVYFTPLILIFIVNIILSIIFTFIINNVISKKLSF